MSLIALVLAAAFSMNVQADSLHPDTFTFKPVVNNVQIVVKGICDPSADVCPAVEPWTEITFTHTSCGSMPFSVSKVESLTEEPTIVSLTLPSDIHDCAGPTTPHTYTLQLEEAYHPGQLYILANPIAFVPTI